jgi:hypothetical protein
MRWPDNQRRQGTPLERPQTTQELITQKVSNKRMMKRSSFLSLSCSGVEATFGNLKSFCPRVKKYPDLPERREEGSTNIITLSYYCCSCIIIISYYHIIIYVKLIGLLLILIITLHILLAYYYYLLRSKIDTSNILIIISNK